VIVEKQGGYVIMGNIVNLFNRLTDNRLADYHLFENIIDDHYDKFRYFYLIVSNIDMHNVIKINGGVVSNMEVLFFIEAEEAFITDYYDDISKNHQCLKNNYFNKYFKVKIDQVYNGINIYIECIYDDENEIYKDNYAFL
jgi:hypothetical protein